MIVAAGLTPAWQQILRFPDFHLGEVNRAVEAHWCASGKAINVALAIRHLGGNVTLVSPCGGIVGEQLRRDCEQFGVNATWIETAAPTRVCTTILDEHSRTTTELVENAKPLSAMEIESFVQRTRELKAGVLVLSGSLSTGAPATVYRDILAGFSGRAILDARGDELKAALPHRPFLVKPNREELAKTVGRSLSDEASIWQAMDDVHHAGAEWVMVSAGAKASLVAGPEGRFRLQPPTAPVVNPIGCGDCLAAGIAWSLDEGNSPLDAIRHGMGAAADNLGQLLPARLDRKRVLAFADQVRIERI